MRTSLRLARQLLLLSAVLLTGCVWLGPRVQVADTAPVQVAALPAPVAGNGSIFQSASYRPLFEDHRARLAGDTLTVQIIEKVSATQKSTSTVDKGGTLSASITELPGVRPSAFARATADATSGNNFQGKGTTESSNDFSGTITVVVRGV
ncbi:MAG: flagellar basal body L-ring protein FlgH, partial [Rubrivivax sp.]|nr:flagellar basal body L-ring protein FlgH [Rubrivivax sp.]